MTAMTATHNEARDVRATATPGFTATIASEWAKLWSLRSTKIILSLCVILGFGITALVTTLIGSTWSDWSASDQAAFDPVMTSLVGSIFSLLLLVVLSVMVVTSEYSSGMIRLTLTATPQRGRVLAAKMLLVSLVSLVVGTLTLVGMLWIGQGIFRAYDVPAASLTDGSVTRLILGMMLTAPVFPLFALAIGVLLRSTAGAITAVLGLVFLPSMFGPLFPRWWQENILSFLPANATDAIALAAIDGDNPLYLQPGVAAVVVLGWLILFIGAAYRALMTRDVSGGSS